MRRQLVVAGRDGAILLHAIDQPLDPIARSIGDAVELALVRLARPPRDHRADASAGQLAPGRLAAVALIVPSRRGRSFGGPRPRRLIAPWASNWGRALCSWRWPAVTTKVTGLPRPSARTWILVLNPPRLRPRAWSPPPFWPPLHVGGPAPRSRRRSGSPSPPLPGHPRRSGEHRGPSPRSPPGSSAGSG
jgi:hypothetical protein